MISVVVHLLSCVRPFATSWTAENQASLSFTISQSLLKFLSIESVMPYNHLTLCRPLLLLPLIFPSTRYFQMNWLFASGGQSIGAPASVLPLNIQDWFPEYWHSNFEYQIFIFRNRISMNIDIPMNIQDWLVWSPCSPRDSQESVPTPQFNSINSSALRLLYGLMLTSIHDYWKSHSFDLWTFVSKVMSLLSNTLSRFIIAILPGVSIF